MNCDLPKSPSQVAGITGVRRCPQLTSNSYSGSGSSLQHGVLWGFYQEGGFHLKDDVLSIHSTMCV
jgi:hypothetical protein